MEDPKADDLSVYLAKHETEARTDLLRLVRIPSVNAPGHPLKPLKDCARAVALLATKAGLENVQLLEPPRAAPYVYADWLHATAKPTILLYAHYDVQPVGRVAEWSTPPFDPVVKNNRMYGRGTADDKAGILVHLSALTTWLRTYGQLPVNVRLLVEGEEENGSPHCKRFLEHHAPRLGCDLMVIADSSNWEVGKPSITHSLRGATTLTIEITAMRAAVHSGLWGGVVPDPLMALCKTLAGLTDEHGIVAVPGFMDDLQVPDVTQRSISRPVLKADAVRAHTSLNPGATLVGDEKLSLTDRLWYQPCLSIRGLDAPAVIGSPNVIQPSARAQINVRLGPGQNPESATRRLVGFIKQTVPWGLQVTVSQGSAYPAWYADPTGPVFQAAARATEEAYAAPVTFIGTGGSVPLVGWFLEALGAVPVLLTGVEDPDSGAHGPDESLDLAAWQKACYAEALFLHEAALALG